MKKIFTLAMFVAAFCLQTAAQKTVYIPNEWRNPWPSDSLLYKESDPDNKYTWSKSRSVESDNVIIFWDKYYGNKKPHELSKSDWNYVDIPDLLQKCEAFFDLEINKLGFVDPVNSNLNKYKVMVLMNYSKPGDWACYGGGYDYQVSALWLNSATCKPVGHSVAHEVGHSFHYMCYAEHSGHQDSSTDNTGFHLACGNGQAIWEQTAQWQAAQSYPELMFDQSIGVFRNSHNYAYSHEWHRYQSYWFHYFINQYYNDLTTVAQVWNTPMTGQSRGKGSDFNQALMKLKNLSVRDLYKLYFDYASRLATWDIEACKPYRNPYIGDFNYRCVLTDDDEYQVALASCPQGAGFNVIPLEVPQSGTVVKTNLTGLNPGSALLDNDPGEFLNGDTQWEKVSNRKYQVSTDGNASWRGFRMGYVALMADGSRRYFSEDSVYCQGRGVKTASYQMTVPEGVIRLWLVVTPALSGYITHRWDEKIGNDDMWPYRFSLEGTDIATSATVYASAILDGRDVSDITFTYDVTFPRDVQYYSGTTITVGGRAAAALGTALQLQPTVIASKMQTWNASGVALGKISFYAADANGTLIQKGSTANGYGHWFTATGGVTDYGNSASRVFSEFYPSLLTFSIGQYPDRCPEGSKYTIRQTLRYRQKGNVYANANFVFNITVGGSAASATLVSTDYTDPATGVIAIDNGKWVIDNEAGSWYTVDGMKLRGKPTKRGLYIMNGQKVVIK